MTGMPGAEIAPRLGAAPPRSLRRRSDERLVRIARDGDERAFELLFERHGQAILRYCRSLLRAPEEAEDVRQEVFVLAISALRRGAEPRSFRPWLYRIAHNACVSHLRARRPVLVADDGVLAGPDAAVEPADVHREDLRQLLDDIRRLPEIQRGALLLREMDGFSYEQVGEVLGVPPSTVRASIFRARRTLHGLAEARDADCQAIQTELSELADRRGRRNRRITAHLRVCPSCRSFRDALRRRPAILRVTAPSAPAFVPVAPIGALLALKAKLFGGASVGAVAAAGGGGGVAKVAAVASTCALLATGLEAERALDAGRADRPAGARETGAATYRDGPGHARRAASSVAAAPAAGGARSTARTTAPGAVASAPPDAATVAHRRSAPDSSDERPARRAPRPLSSPPAVAATPQVTASPDERREDGGDARDPGAEGAAGGQRPAPGGDERDEDDDRSTTPASGEGGRSDTPSSWPIHGHPAAPGDRADEDDGDGPPNGKESPAPAPTAATAATAATIPAIPGEGAAPAAPAPAGPGDSDGPAPGEAGSTGPAPDDAGDDAPQP